MKIGISTASFYPIETEKALQTIVEHGVECTEIFINAPSELSKEYTATFRSIISGGQTEVVSIHPYTSPMEHLLFFSNYERRFSDAIELYKGYFELAAELGAGYIVMHGGATFCYNDMNFYAHQYNRICEEAERFGVKIAHENVVRNIGNMPEFFVKLREILPNANFVLDIKQAIRSGYTALDYVQAMGKNIAHLHLSDSDSKHDCMTVGSGNFDFYELFSQLKTINYAGSAVVELYNDSYKNNTDLWNSIDFLQKVSKKL